MKLFDRFKRLNERINKFANGRRLYCYISILCNRLFRGFSAGDFFAFGFYRMNFWQQGTYLSQRKSNRIEKKLNQNCDLLIDKSKFNLYFSDFLKRDWLDLHNCTYEEFSVFVKKHPTCILKQNWLCEGQGISKININESEIDSRFQELKGSYTILEEVIVQHPTLSALNPTSCNTIRVATLRKNKTVHIIATAARIGRMGACTDNLHGGGLCCSIDRRTGIIVSCGYTGDGTAYIKHPDTQQILLGVQIPHWDKIISMVTDAALSLKDNAWIGWDVAVTENDVCLIEGNTNHAVDLIQIGGIGIVREIQKILAE